MDGQQILPIMSVIYYYALTIKSLVSTETMNRVVDKIRQCGMVSIERPLKSTSNKTTFHISVPAKQPDFESAFNCFKATLYKLLVAPNNGYQIPGTDIPLNRDQFVLYMQPASPYRLEYWQKTMSLARLGGWRLQIRFVANIVCHVLAGVLIALTAVYFNTHQQPCALPHRMMIYGTGFGLLFNRVNIFFIYGYKRWHTDMMLMAVIATGIVALQWSMEQWMGEFPYSSYVSTIVYELCRLALMLFGNHKTKQITTRINAIKKHLRLPFIRFVLFDDAAFQREAIKQMLFPLLGTLFDTFVLFLKTYGKEWYCTTMNGSSKHPKHQNSNECEYMDENDPHARWNRRTVVMPDYSLEGFYIDMFCLFVYEPLAIFDYPVLWGWPILRLLIEVGLSYIKAIFLHKLSVELDESVGIDPSSTGANQ
ncbi:uncharacterized protein LOC118509995 [Anopheles stephensi]|uniref:uncharacterized protein LOC118509995 n=1 Tax=Anopheles stephensi TaxID=30069 RepID=UPI0016587F4D|nr:uncharacterized protein LOC118509995 [Anopheles stephensi]